ncbi:MAG: hypothetical protein EXR62_18730 [Chloroflexi bacterium]|nr:hypothetical protein [Chloroflexota bacterium]
MIFSVAERVFRSSRRIAQHYLPQPFWQHWTAAEREALLALRYVVDAGLTMLENSTTLPRTSREEKIDIEIDGDNPPTQQSQS